MYVFIVVGIVCVFFAAAFFARRSRSSKRCLFVVDVEFLVIMVKCDMCK